MAEFPTLGPPAQIGGADYLKALASLGYNVENMSSSLPMYTKAAQAATSLMDQAFNQRLEWDKAQAANKEAIARANNFDSITDYNNKSLDLRLKALDQENQARDLKYKQDQLGFQYDQDTLTTREGMLKYQTEIQKNKAQADSATLDSSIKVAQAQNEANLADIQRKSQDGIAAQNDFDPTIRDLHNIPLDAPDYEKQFAQWHTQHLNAITNPITAAKIQSEVDNVERQRGKMAAVNKQAENLTELKRLVNGDHLPGNTNWDAKVQDPNQMQLALTQGHMSETRDVLQEIYGRLKNLGAALPAQYKSDLDDLRAADAEIDGFTSAEGYQRVINNESKSLTFDGKLRKQLQGELDDINAYLAEVAKQQAAAKPPEEEIESGGLLPAGHPKVTIKNLRPGQENQFVPQKPAAATLPTPDQLQALLAAHPEIRDIVKQAYAHRSPENLKKMQEAIDAATAADRGAASRGAGGAGAATGFQSGGEVGSTDTVPAMLTPGEFVLTKNATEAIGPGNLAQINQIADNTNSAIGPAVPKLTPIPIGTDATVAAVTGLARPQDQVAHPELATQPTPNAQPTPESDTASVKVVQPTSTAGRLSTSNVSNYAYPTGAPDVNGIDRNVWSNVMSEEGPEFSRDGKHMSVFGLWQDAPGLEGQAYRTIRQYGANSLQAYNAVTDAWNKLFLSKTQPQRLTSPGMQELVIADSQHAGGQATLKIIQQMGGWDAINKMSPTDAINTYSALREHLWPGNSARVNRERAWALANNDTLSGSTQVAGMQTGGMVAPNPNFNPAYNMQAPVQGMTMPGTTAGQMVGDPLQPSFDPSMIMPMAPQPDLTTGEMFPPPNRPVYQMQHGGEVPDGGGGAGGFEAELDQPGGGAGEGQRHRRFHPRMAGMGGMGAQPNIPDPMQKKVAKLSQDFIGGLSSMIRSRPELGGAIMAHAKNMLASTGLGEVRSGETGQGSSFLGGTTQRQQPMVMNPAMLAMSGGEGSSSEESYT